jgi:hypothetical protein
VDEETFMFTWRVSGDGYCWAGATDKRVLLPQSGNKGDREYRPMEEKTGLFLTFSAVQPTEAGILSFANEHGLLGVGSREVLGGVALGDLQSDERLPFWAQQILAMRENVQRWDDLRKRAGGQGEKDGLYKAVNNYLHRSWWYHVFGLPTAGGDLRRIVTVDLEKLATMSPPPLLQLIGPSLEGKATLEASPVNLLNALWLQFADAVAADTQFRQCPSCGSWFAVAPERRRADAQYCKEACRIRAYKERKKEARRLHAAGRTPNQIAKKLGTTVEVVGGWITEEK